jgi:hypothetical protein
MMDEPRRMLDQNPSAFERLLLEEGRACRPPDAIHAKTLSALGFSASAGIVGGLVARLSAKGWATKVVLGISAVTLLGSVPAAYLMLAKHEAPTRPARAALSSPPPVAVEEVPATATPAAMPPVPATPPAPTRASAPAGSALRAELLALDAVRSRLADRDFENALSLLTSYFRSFPRGHLRPEAEVLRIDAFAKAGQMTSAKKYAQEFVRRYPNSLLTARVRPYAER